MALAWMLPSASWPPAPVRKVLHRPHPGGCLVDVEGMAWQARPAFGLSLHAHAPAGPGARLDPLPITSPFGRGGRCCLRWLGVGFGRGNARQPSCATAPTARPAPGQQPNCGCYWHFAMSVLGYLLFIGRVYKHGASIYEMRTGTRMCRSAHKTRTRTTGRRTT